MHEREVALRRRPGTQRDVRLASPEIDVLDARQHLQLNLRILLPDQAGKWRDEVECDARWRGDAYQAGRRRIAELCGVAELARPFGHVTGGLDPALTLAGERRTLDATIEQRVAEARFQLRQAPAHGWLSDAQVARGFSQAAVIRDCQEQPHVLQLTSIFGW